MSDFSYAWEKLNNAVRALVGSGSHRERMIHAFSSLHTLDPPEQKVPKNMVKEFTQFLAGTHSVSAKGDEGRFTATVNSMSESELTESAEKILHFYDTICRHREPLN